MSLRESFPQEKNAIGKFIPVEGMQNEALCAYPIISGGDVIGSVCALKSENPEVSIDEIDRKIDLTKITSEFLGKHLED